MIECNFGVEFDWKETETGQETRIVNKLVKEDGNLD